MSILAAERAPQPPARMLPFARAPQLTARVKSPVGSRQRPRGASESSAKRAGRAKRAPRRFATQRSDPGAISGANRGRSRVRDPARCPRPARASSPPLTRRTRLKTMQPKKCPYCALAL
eukprot:5773575-Prymnesium_polylepis.2